MDCFNLWSLFSGWMGFVLLITFGIATAYSASCLGTCWLILEERYPQYRIYPVPDPYPTIALHAVGRRTRYLYCSLLIHYTCNCNNIVIAVPAAVYRWAMTFVYTIKLKLNLESIASLMYSSNCWVYLLT